jgi:hypothetical protein
MESADVLDLASLPEPSPGAGEVPAELELTRAELDDGPALAVPTRPVSLTVLTVDGSTLRGRVFLRMNAEAHAGPETVQDRLNDPDLFLTLSTPGETPVVFLNKIQLIRIELPEELPEAEGLLEGLETGPEAAMEPIRVQLINGEQLSGSVRIEGPTGKMRLSDFLNTQPAFFSLKGTDRLHLLHKRFIARVMPQAS